jgi:hypothetical protein
MTTSGMAFFGGLRDAFGMRLWRDLALLRLRDLALLRLRDLAYVLNYLCRHAFAKLLMRLGMLVLDEKYVV